MNLVNQNNELTFGGLVDAVQHIEDYTSQSLTMYTKRAIVNSRVYIENNLSNEEILNPLMMNIMNIYTGFLMTAVNMNQYVNGTKKVRDMMSVVSTESIDQVPTYIEDRLDQFFMGSKSHLLGNNTKNQFGIHPSMISIEDSNLANPEDSTGYLPGNVEGVSKSQVINPEAKDVTLPSGRIVEIKFGSDKNPNGFAINLFLQLSPMFIPSNVAGQFVGMNFTPSIRQRWMQASAGEIGFVKDLIMCQDRRKARLKALKNDNTGALAEMIQRQENNLQSSWLKLMFVTPERQNIANTILIFDKHNFDKSCSSAGLRFKDYNQRQKFFNKTFSMIICTIDPMYNKIDMFYNGLDAVSNFTFEQMKKNAKTEAADLMSLMKQFSAGMAPKF